MHAYALCRSYISQSQVTWNLRGLYCPGPNKRLGTWNPYPFVCSPTTRSMSKAVFNSLVVVPSVTAQ
jgi:hypothetical protein